jgi:hypothetical protein
MRAIFAAALKRGGRAWPITCFVRVPRMMIRSASRDASLRIVKYG